MIRRNKIIDFTKEKLENLKYSGKREWWFAKNFEGLCIRVNKHKKTYYVHWSIPKYKDGKFIRVGKKKWLCEFYIPLAEVKTKARQKLDEWKKQSLVKVGGLTVDGLARAFIKNGARGYEHIILNKS